MAFNDDRRQAFRCSVASEIAAAKLHIGSRAYDVLVRETSREGYTIVATERTARRVESNCKKFLSFNGETWQVECSGVYQEDPQQIRIGLVRVRDCTRFKIPSSWGFALLPKSNVTSDPTLPVGMIIAFLVVTMCLPGAGDSLGTAPRVRKAIHGIMDFFDKTVVQSIF